MIIAAATLVGLSILLSIIVLPFAVFGSEEDSSGGEQNDGGSTSDTGGNDNNNEEQTSEPEPEPEVPEEPPIEEIVQPVEPEPCPPDQDVCDPEQPVDPCAENPDLDECQPTDRDPCVENPDLDECQPDPCLADPNAPGCVDPCKINPDLPICQPIKCGKGTHLENRKCVKDNGGSSSSSSSSTTTIINPSEVSSCKLDGSTHGIQQKFDTAKYQACGLYPNGQIAYTDGFVAGCTQVGNTQLICQALIDSSILNMRTQPTQTQTQSAAQATQAIQPTAVGE